MWTEKLVRGVLCLLTPIGRRYFEVSFFHRIYLLWIFRHFTSLPQQVLTPGEQRFVERVCATGRSFAAHGLSFGPEQIVIGTVERLAAPDTQDLPRKRPIASAAAAGFATSSHTDLAG